MNNVLSTSECMLNLRSDIEKLQTAVATLETQRRELPAATAVDLDDPINQVWVQARRLFSDYLIVRSVLEIPGGEIARCMDSARDAICDDARPEYKERIGAFASMLHNNRSVEDWFANRPM